MLTPPLFVGGVEKPILPHGHNEDSDRRDSPQVRKEQVAWLLVEAEKAQREKRQGYVPPAFDRAHGEQESDGKKWQPLVGPDLVGDQGAERESERHPVGGVPPAAPRRPRGRSREYERAGIGKEEGESREME